MKHSQVPLRYFVGLDLGQVSEYTAVAVLSRPAVSQGTARELRRPAYAVPHLERLPMGTPYPEVVEYMLRLLKTPELEGCVFAVDQTGVGRAVVDLLAERLCDQVTCTFAPVTITTGHQVQVAHGLNVPKKELVSTLQVLLQSRRLQVSRSLPDAETLIRELERFRLKIATARNETYEAWREGAHDDLVLAVGMAAWCGEKGLPPVVDPPEPPRYTYLRAR